MPEQIPVEELTPMMQQYIETKKSMPTASFSTVWEIFMRCFSRTPGLYPVSWN